MEDDNESGDRISKFLGMRSIDEVVASNSRELIAQTTPLPEVQADPRKDEDFEEARDMMKKVLEVGTTAVEAMAEIANQSQNPQAYEKLGALINSMTSASKTLMDLHKTKKVIDKVDKENPDLKDPSGPSEVHNHLYVGSTADLQNFIQDMRKDKDE